jgi:26S proteasome regulatory subunit T5
MSSARPPAIPPPNPEKQSDTDLSSSADAAAQDGAMDTSPDQPAEETWADIPEEIMGLNTDEIFTRTRLIENDIKVCLL